MKRLFLLAIIGAALAANAQNWSAPVAVTTGAGDDHNLDIQRDPLILGYAGYWVAWDRTVGENSDVFHAKFFPSTDTAFTDVCQVTFSPAVEEMPAIMVNGAEQSGVFFQSPNNHLSAIYFAERTGPSTFTTPWLTLYSDVHLYEPIYCGIIEDIGIIPALYLRSDSAVVPVSYEYLVGWPFHVPADTAFQAPPANSGHIVLSHDGDWTSLFSVPIQLQKFAWETVIEGRSEIGYYFQTVDSLLNVHIYEGILSDPIYYYVNPVLNGELWVERLLSGYDIAQAEFDETTGEWTTPEPRFDMPGSERTPFAVGNSIVFKNNQDGNWDIAFWHPSLSQPEIIDSNPAEDRNPVLVEDAWTSQYHVFWESNRDGSWKIYYSHRDVLGIVPEPKGSLPASFAVSVHPNPGNAEFRIDLELPVSEEVEAAIYDLSGRRVARIHDGLIPAGSQELSWDASEIASGIYLLRVESADNIQTRKMVVLK